MATSGVWKGKTKLEFLCIRQVDLARPASACQPARNEVTPSLLHIWGGGREGWRKSKAAHMKRRMAGGSEEWMGREERRRNVGEISTDEGKNVWREMGKGGDVRK